MQQSFSKPTRVALHFSLRHWPTKQKGKRIKVQILYGLYNFLNFHLHTFTFSFLVLINIINNNNSYGYPKTHHIRRVVSILF